MVICIPSGSTNVEIRAVRDSAEHAGGREVYMIYEPMAAALGAGLDVEAPEGNMVVDIGGGTTEIACISLGGIVCSESINVAGDVFTEDIQTYIRQQHNMRIGERTAEDIKIAVGAALSELEEEPEDFEVTGPNILTSLPSVLSVSYSEMAYALEKSLVKIDAAIMKVLERFARIVCRHRPKRDLPRRRRSVAQRARPEAVLRKPIPVPHRRRPAARRSAGHGHCAEEHRTFFVLDAITL